MNRPPLNFMVTRIGANRVFLDTALLGACVGLLILGFIMVTSATLHIKPDDMLFYAKKQALHIVFGLALAVIVVQLPLELWRKYWLPLFVLGVTLLAIVLFPKVGAHVKGATRWLELKGVRIQVSEIFKLIAIIYMASFIARRIDQLRASGLVMLLPLGVLGLSGILILLEPDFGALVVIMATAFAMLFLAGCPLWTMGLVAVAGGAGAVALVFMKSYRIDRIWAFLSPWDQAQKQGYQVVHALMSFGRGEWLGVGLGSGVQKLGYLPEAHTDYLLSVIGEELGLVGTWSVVFLFSLVVWRAFKVARGADRAGLLFNAYVAYGIGIWLAIQSFINIGVNLGVLPPKGLTLPLMSYGGGSMIISCIALALLFRVRSETIALRLSRQREQMRW